jgi:hypothetical protein
MGVVASCFCEIVCDAFLEHLIRSVWKSKKPIDDQSAGASDEHQEEGKKCIHGEMLRRAL